EGWGQLDVEEAVGALGVGEQRGRWGDGGLVVSLICDELPAHPDASAGDDDDQEQACEIDPQPRALWLRGDPCGDFLRLGFRGRRDRYVRRWLVEPGGLCGHLGAWILLSRLLIASGLAEKGCEEGGWVGVGCY